MNLTFRTLSGGVSIDVRRFPVFRTLPYFLKKARIDLVLDVGANEGQFIEQIRKGGYTGEIAAFEPLKKESAMLQAKYGSKKVRVHSCALSNFSGTSQLHFYPETTELASFHQTNVTFHSQWGDVNKTSVEVQTVRLDDVWKDLGASNKRVFMKIDTQGSDYAVLEGSESSLNSILGVQTELSINPIYKNQKGIQQTIDFLRSRGFFLHLLSPVVTSKVTGELLETDGVFFKQGSL